MVETSKLSIRSFLRHGILTQAALAYQGLFALFPLTLAVSTIYHFVPNTNKPFRFVIPGAVVAVVVWTLASLGFSFYLSNFANYGVIYGSLGAAIALLTYLYLSAALLLGAEVNEAVYRNASE
jgi:membrane protein